jgi:4-aminobutyrate aminotransferase-like enzyme
VQRAGREGPALRAAVGDLARTHSAIGDVRGLGLLTGVELVDAEGAPDAALAGAVKNLLRERGVLVGSTGPADNVLKVRPPLVFGEEHIPLVVDALDAALTSVGR